MAVTIASLTTRYPEFTNADSALVQAAIDDAKSHYDEDACGDLYDRIVTEAACQQLARSPWAQEMAVDGQRGLQTKHDMILARLIRSAGSVSTGHCWSS
jgi:hypothetical protein